MYNHGWSVLSHGRNQHNIIKQFPPNLKKKEMENKEQQIRVPDMGMRSRGRGGCGYKKGNILQWKVGSVEPLVVIL